MRSDFLVTQSSLIVSTYNWPEALALCLQSILAQKQLPAEVLIADDGSSTQTADLIGRYQKLFPVPLLHLWQEDRGFYKTHIINKAVAAAKFPYIIQIDGDVILDTHFIKDHVQIARKDYFVRGSRSLLDKTQTNNILCGTDMPSIGFLRKHCHHKLNALRSNLLTRLMRRYKTKGKNRYSLLGCNMAYWRNDFIRINGLNEEITGWGCEDKEFAVRMLNAGYKKQTLKMGGVVFHLHHPARSRENLPNHYRILQHSIVNEDHSCLSGIDKYLCHAR